MRAIRSTRVAAVGIVALHCKMYKYYTYVPAYRFFFFLDQRGIDVLVFFDDNVRPYLSMEYLKNLKSNDITTTLLYTDVLIAYRCRNKIFLRFKGHSPRSVLRSHTIPPPHTHTPLYPLSPHPAVKYFSGTWEPSRDKHLLTFFFFFPFNSFHYRNRSLKLLSLESGVFHIFKSNRCTSRLDNKFIALLEEIHARSLY